MDCFASLAMTKDTIGVQLMTTPLAAKIAREYGTPCAVIDMDRVERNIARIQVACDTAGVANRPHIKTHKSPLLAQMQGSTTS
jgi:D-serine deaminase-like pyridoxal phosphate-dependent protein